MSILYADDYPNVFSAYPLHLACYNKECPDEVVELLIKKSDDSVFSNICCIDIDWTKSDIHIDDDDGAGVLLSTFIYQEHQTLRLQQSVRC